jgi:hypothetical protein
MEFVQQQSKQERDLFDAWLNRAMKVLAIITAVVAVLLVFMGFNTVDGIKKAADRSITRAIQEAQTKVQERIDAEFRTEAIKTTIRQVAAERTAAEFRSVISDEVRDQLKNNPQFAQIVRHEVETQTRQFVQAETARQLAKATSPRRITESQRQHLVALLSPYKGSSIKVSSLIGNSEAATFAQQFVSVFRAAGWKVDFEANISWDNGFRGLGIAFKKGEPEPQLGIAVTGAFRQVGIKLHTEDDLNIPPNSLNLWVSEKEIAD